MNRITRWLPPIFLLLCLTTTASPQDPGLAWTTLLGGSDFEVIQDAARTSTGDWIVVGQGTSLDFPISANAYQPTQAGGGDSFVAKVSADGSTLIWSTYIGGPKIDEAWRVEVDSLDRPVVAGYTESDPFSLTVSGVGDNVLSGLGAGFVCRLQANGQGLDWWTYVDGAYYDEILSLVLGPNDEPWVCGFTGSYDFPTVGSAAVPFPGSGWNNESGFLTGLSADGTTILLSTCLGGVGGRTEVAGLALDPGGGWATLCGLTTVSGLATPGAFDTTRNGFEDGVLARVNLATGAFPSVTYLGGNRRDNLKDVKVHASGDILAVGDTDSADFPSTPGAFQTVYAGRGDVTASRFSADLSTLVASTFLGTSADEDEFVSMVSGAPGFTIAMSTNSADFPITAGAWDSVYNDPGEIGDIVLVRLDDFATTLEYSSFLGGDFLDLSLRAVADQGNRILVVGLTSSSTFPARGAGFDHQLSGLADGFIGMFDLSTGPILSGGPLQRGAATTFQVSGVAFGEAVFLGLSTVGTGFGVVPVGFGGVRLDILSPMLIGTGSGGMGGTADILVQVPMGAPLVGVTLQVIAQKGVGGATSLVSQPLFLVVQP